MASRFVQDVTDPLQENEKLVGNFPQKILVCSWSLNSYPGLAKHKTSEDSNGIDDMDKSQNAVPQSIAKSV